MFNKLKIEVCQLTVAEIKNPSSVTNLTPSPQGKGKNPSDKPTVCHLPFQGRRINGKF